MHPLCSQRKSAIHGLTVPTEGQLDEKHIYCMSIIFLHPWKPTFQMDYLTNHKYTQSIYQGTCLVVNDNTYGVVARWDTSQLQLCSVPEQSPRHTFHTRRQAPNHATSGVDVVLTPGAPRWVGVTVSHTSAAAAAAVGVGVEGELRLAICLRPRIPIWVQESWPRCRIHTQNPSSMKKKNFFRELDILGWRISPWSFWAKFICNFLK